MNILVEEHSIRRNVCLHLNLAILFWINKLHFQKARRWSWQPTDWFRFQKSISSSDPGKIPAGTKRRPGSPTGKPFRWMSRGWAIRCRWCFRPASKPEIPLTLDDRKSGFRSAARTGRWRRATRWSGATTWSSRSEEFFYFQTSYCSWSQRSSSLKNTRTNLK